MARRMRRSVTSLVRTWLSTMFRRCVATSTITISVFQGSGGELNRESAAARQDAARLQMSEDEPPHRRTLQAPISMIHGAFFSPRLARAVATWRSGDATDCKSVHP